MSNSRLGFLHFEWWLDEDGVHVWTRHDCGGETVETMLPHPNWRVDEGGRTFTPSFHCLACGTHTHGGGCRIEESS